MKNKSLYREDMQSIKFEKKINHLQSFIGMPMWQGRKPTLSEIREYDRRLLERQVVSYPAKKKSLYSRIQQTIKRCVSKTLSSFLKARIKNVMPKDTKIKTQCC